MLKNIPGFVHLLTDGAAWRSIGRELITLTLLWSAWGALVLMQGALAPAAESTAAGLRTIVFWLVMVGSWASFVVASLKSPLPAALAALTAVMLAVMGAAGFGWALLAAVIGVGLQAVGRRVVGDAA